MTNLEKVLEEIDANLLLTAEQKLARKAGATRAWRELHGQVTHRRELQHKATTTIWHAFSRSLVRAFGTNLMRALFRK